MKKSEVLKFKKLLLEQREGIVEEIHRENMSLSMSQRDSAGDLSGYAFHMADAGSDTYEREFAGQLVTAEQKMVYEIDEALMRIKNRTYGICEKCSKEIGKRRLEIIPYARLCRKCVQESEGK